MAADTETFHPQDTLANTAKSTIQTTLAGTIFAGAQNTLRKQNVGAMGIITKSGGIIGVFASGGAAYQFTRDSAANLRGIDDAYNEALGGMAAGMMVGLARRSLPFMFGAGASFGVALAAFKYTGGLAGKEKPLDDQEVERREAERKMRRRPLSETIEQLGEGRGIYAPGYLERRRDRLLEKYGVDVGPYQRQSE